jgi:hypothetical protein
VTKANTALVPVAPAATEERPAPRPDNGASTRANGGAKADFVAHLIATRNRLPQTCARRRAAPETAIAAYAALGHWPIPSGRALSRSL